MITSEPLVGMAEPSTRAKWRALRSARSSTLKKCLTGIHIVREARSSECTEQYAQKVFDRDPHCQRRLFSPIIYENWCCGPVISPVRFVSSQRKKADGMDIPIGNPSRQKRRIVGGTCF